MEGKQKGKGKERKRIGKRKKKWEKVKGKKVKKVKILLYKVLGSQSWTFLSLVYSTILFLLILLIVSYLTIFDSIHIYSEAPP